MTPNTTAEQNLLTAGQRRVNLIWEVTQAVIAIGVTLTTLWVSGSIAVSVTDAGANSGVIAAATAAFLLLSNAFFLVIGFYFGRTNHARAGDHSLGSQVER